MKLDICRSRRSFESILILGAPTPGHSILPNGVCKKKNLLFLVEQENGPCFLLGKGTKGVFLGIHRQGRQILLIQGRDEAGQLGPSVATAPQSTSRKANRVLASVGETPESNARGDAYAPHKHESFTPKPRYEQR